VQILFELKLPSGNLYEAIAESLEYLDAAVTHRPVMETSRVAIASNFQVIQSFFTPSKLVKDDLVRSGYKMLFPEKWSDLEEPTDGFKMLCHALSIRLPASRKVIINGKRHSIRGTMQENLEAAVYIVEPDCEAPPIVVKVALGKRATGIMLSFEKSTVEAVAAIEELEPYAVKLLPEYEVQNGFAMEMGESLILWYQELVSEDSRKSIPVGAVAIANADIKPHLHHLFRGLRVLHKYGWCHRDIRPANLVLVHGMAKLIDWATAARKEDPVDRLFSQGYGDPFAHEDVGRFGQSGEKLDFIGLGFVALFFGSSAEEQKLCADVTSRRNYIRTLAEEYPQRAKDLAVIGAYLIEQIEETGQAALTEEDCDCFEQLLI
jgi:hypothetical protein